MIPAREKKAKHATRKKARGDTREPGAPTKEPRAIMAALRGNEMDLHTKVMLENFTIKLQRRQIVGSFQCAMETAECLKQIVSKSHTKTPEQLVQLLKQVGGQLVAAAPIGEPVSRLLLGQGRGVSLCGAWLLILLLLLRADDAPAELAVGNIVRRVLQFVREEVRLHLRPLASSWRRLHGASLCASPRNACAC